MFFYEWGFLLILENDQKWLQRFLEKGNEEGGILDAPDDQKYENSTATPPLFPSTF